jgi:sarcosine oxidase
MNRRDFLSTGFGVAAALTAPAARSAQAGESTSTSANFDIAIIGAGLFGSAAARHLSKTSDGIALIGPAEPVRPQQHQGAFASHFDASRLTRIVDPDLVWGTLARRSVDRYRDLEQESGIDFYNEIGYMMVTPGGLGTEWFDLPAMREVASDLDVAVEDLDDAELQSQFPYLRFTPGSSAMLQRADAGYIDPRGLLVAQQGIGTAQGVTLLREEVTRISDTGGQTRIDTRSGRSLRAKRVLLATGAYANAAGLLRERLDVKVRAAMIMLSEVGSDTRPEFPGTLYAKTDGEEDFWGLLMPPVTYPDGRSYIKTMDGYYGPTPLRTTEEFGDWCRNEGHTDHHSTLKRALREVFPSLDVLGSRFQGCLITDTATHYPYIDMLTDRLGIVAGGNGKAAKSSDEIGRIAAAMMRSGSWESTLPQALFAANFV